MAKEITEQIVREAPDIEAYKLGLLKSAKGLADKPVKLPGYKVAGFNPDQLAAFKQARAGIGDYQPYLYGGTQALKQGVGTTREAADVLRGADTRNQFKGAQQAMDLAGRSAGQLDEIANRINPSYRSLTDAERMTRSYQQADLDASERGFDQGARVLTSGIGQYDPRSVRAFMNPYQQQVINQANQEINRQQQLAAQQQAAQAAGAGAFGGSRQAIQRSELDRNTAQLRNQTISNLLSQGYTQAQAQAQAAYEQAQQRDIAVGQALGQQAAARGQMNLSQTALGQQAAQNIAQQAAMRGQLAGQQAGILGQQAGLYSNIGQNIGSLAGQQYGIGQSMAQTLGQFGTQLGNLGIQQAALGQSAQQLGQQDVNFLYNIGQQQQALTQQQLDAQRNTALQQAYEPYQRLAFLSDIYKGAPSSQQSISAATAPTPSAFQQAVGTGIAGLAAGTAAKKAGLF